jgi:hypothetical protein
MLNSINRLFMAQQDDDQSTVKVVTVEEEEDDQSTVKVVMIEEEEEEEEEDESSGVTDKQFKQWEKDNDPEQYWQVTSLSAFVWFRLFLYSLLINLPLMHVMYSISQVQSQDSYARKHGVLWSCSRCRRRLEHQSH